MRLTARVVGTCAAAFAALAIVVGSVPSARAAPPEPEGPPNEPEIVTTPNLPPSAAGRFLMRPRAEDSGRYWSPSNDRYSSTYVRPSAWAVELDGCGSSGGSDPRGRVLAITTFDWRLEPLEGQANPVAVTSPSCRNTQARVGGLGRWRVELTVRSASGRVARADIGTRRLRDVVVVAFGDSYVSGEGNPDTNAVYEDDFVLVERPRWTDKQCHRSRASWAMRAASRFEDSNTSVTFLSFACSGAVVDNLLSGGYKGIQPISGGRDKRLVAQLAAARDALGPPMSRTTRPVHAVLMSVGVNDTGFKDVLTQCAAFNAGVGIDIPGVGPVSDRPCSTAGLTRGVRNSIAMLRHAWDRLEVGLDANLLAPTVRFVEYPSRIVTNGRDQHDGCGAFTGISNDEARWISNRGNELNAAMAEAAERNGWGYVGGIRDAFRGHGYCAGDTWFRSWSGSKKLQRNISGTAHPIWAGHRAAGEIVAATIPAESQAAPRPAQLRVEFLRVRIDAVLKDPTAGSAQVTQPIRPGFGVDWHGTRHVPADERTSIPLGRWIAIPEADRTTIVATRGETIGVRAFAFLPALRIEDPDAPKGFVTTGPRNFRFYRIHRRAGGWQTGTHLLTASRNGAEMKFEYRVTEELHNPGFQLP